MDQLIQNCLHRDSSHFPFEELQSLNGKQWDSFIGLAADHRVVTILFFNITNYLTSNGILMQDLSSEFRSSVERMFDKTGLITRYNLRLFSELQSLLKRFKVEKIPVIILKGAFLAHEVYPGLGMREMDDIDLMFKKEDLKRVFEVLNELGFKPKIAFEKESIDAKTEFMHNLVQVTKGDCTIEIHWNIVSPGRPSFIESSVLWEHAKKIKITEQPAMVFSADDFLQHLCHNFSYYHLFGFGLRPVYDILAFIEHMSATLDWGQVVERAHSFGWHRGVWLSLYLAENLFGAQVPRHVLEELLPDQKEGEAIVAIAQKQLYTDLEVLSVLRNVDRLNIDQEIDSGWLGDRFRTALKRFINPGTTKGKSLQTKVSQGKEAEFVAAGTRKKALTDWLSSAKN